MKAKNVIIWIVILAALVAIATILWPRSPEVAQAPTQQPSPAQAVIATAHFACDGGKTIKATFFTAGPVPSVVPGQPPKSNESVSLVLSDGQNITLPQTISADGARFANPDESIVFWNVGNTATITENKQTTYANCKTAQ